jgi:hypothetical protein
MPLSAEMFIVISLMFAVFAAVAAVGSSVVLGVGFERLRAGFELVKKQTGFFSDAIHKLDEHAKILDERTQDIQKSVSGLSTRIDSVEKQSSFFFESLSSLESRILQGSPADQASVSTDMPKVQEEASEPSIKTPTIDWSMTSETGRLLKKRQKMPDAIQPEKPTNTGLSSILVNYLMNDNSPDKRDVVYH